MASLDLILILFTIAAGFGIVIVFVNKKLGELKKNAADPTLIQWLQSMQKSLDQGNKNVADSLSRSTAVLNQRLDSTIGIVASATAEITKMNELGKSIRDLQLLLQSPKLRGSLGEEILENMLGEIFPKRTFLFTVQF